MRKAYASATTMLFAVLTYIVVSMLAVPALDTFEAIDRFFYVSLTGLVAIKVSFIFHLLRDEAYKALLSLLTLLLQLAAALVCLYLFFNWRMGTGGPVAP